MTTLSIHNRSGKKVGKYEIESTDLAPRINRRLLHDVVVMYQANRRQGSAKTKNRSEVSATTKKMYRQKGTGNARAGSRVSGVRRGGGHIFALRPRDYSYRLPKKAVQAATRMAVAAKIRDGEVVLIDQFSFEAPKTREMADILQALGCGQQRLLVTTAAYDPNVYKSARNIRDVDVSPVNELNALSILRARKLVMTPDALDTLKARAAQAKQGATGAKANA